MVAREIFWNIGTYDHILYYLLIPLAAILGYAIYKRCRLWRLGRPENYFLSEVGYPIPKKELIGTTAVRDYETGFQPDTFASTT